MENACLSSLAVLSLLISGVNGLGAERGALQNVPEAAHYALVYSLDIPNTPNYSGGLDYDIDLRSGITEFSRIAYYLELQPTAGALKYLWVSMDAFTADVNLIGVPTAPNGAVFQQPVANLNVVANVAGIVTGTNLTGGNLEFWPSDFTAVNWAGVTNASDTAFDWGDTMATTGSYGSMQIANAEAKQILFAFNRWGGNGGTADLGIGNNPSGSPDYTFAQNAAGYAVKTLQVYVLPPVSGAPALAGAVGRSGLTNVVLTFSKPLEDAATNRAHYAIDGGVNVLDASLDPINRLLVTLTTTPQQPLTRHTVTVNGVRDQTAEQLEVATNSTAVFRSSIAGRGATANVPEAADYTLVYSLDIPNSPNYKTKLIYTEDYSAGITEFSRIAYYLELRQTGGNLNYLWASMDAFTANVKSIGVPTVASKAVFQQPVASLNVASSLASITTGTNLAGGNLEFWPSNYESANAVGVPTASDLDYDWGDTLTAGQHGSMQLHNADAREVLFAFNNWGGNATIADLGIGTNPHGQPDWTFAGNAASYTIKTLQVYVLTRRKSCNIVGQTFQPEGGFKVTCEATPGATYSLWRKSNLSAETWVQVAATTATAETVSLVDSQASDQTGFYQVRTP
jgi:hypothetical protein